MADLLKGYELVEDKTDSTKMEAVADAVLSQYGVPDEVDATTLKSALLSQLIRIANPKSRQINAKSLEPEGIDADSIRVQGFDKVWSKIAPVPSAICYGTDNIDLAAYLRKGIHLHRKFGHIPELDMSSYNLADRLERNFKVTITELVEEQMSAC